MLNALYQREDVVKVRQVSANRRLQKMHPGVGHEAVRFAAIYAVRN